MKQICLITGVGPGTGTALVKRFCAQYQVVMLARNAERLTSLQAQTTNTHA